MNQELMNKWAAQAARNPQRIAFPEATEEKILLAARQSADTGAVLPVLVGNKDTICSAAQGFGVDISNMTILENTQQALEAVGADYNAYNPLFSQKAVCRRGKDPMVYAFILQALGQVDGVFAGLVHTTGEVILAAQTYVGLKDGVSTASSIGILDVPGYEGSEGNSLLVFGDSAVCVAPNEEELADIAISACETVQELLGWEPRCALLSFSTDGSAEHPSAQKVRDAVGIARQKRPDLAIDGEFQLDAAICPAVAAKKVGRDSAVAGRANIVIYPDLSAGNIGVKLMQQFAHADAYGPLLQGFRKPVSDCSRSAPVSELTGNIIMLAVRAGRQQQA